jgi:hypothetical protein
MPGDRVEESTQEREEKRPGGAARRMDDDDAARILGRIGQDVSEVPVHRDQDTVLGDRHPEDDRIVRPAQSLVVDARAVMPSR